MDILKGVWDFFMALGTETKLFFGGVLIIIVLAKVLEIVAEIRKARRLARLGMAEVDELSGQDFEEFVQLLLERLNYEKVKLTPAIADYGIDVTAIDPTGKKIGYQCKRYKKNVGIKAIQEAHTGKNVYQLNQVVVITNSHFTQNAIKTANANDVELIDREGLMDMIEAGQSVVERV